MANITLTIPDALLPRVRAALCAKASLPDTNANAKEAVIMWIKQTVQAYEYEVALAERATITPSDVDDIVT